jgi:peroxiredoxin family protein
MSIAENKMTLVVFSGDLGKVFAAFTMATGAAAAGMDTSMFFTFWGLKAIKKGNLTGTSLLGRMLSVMNRGGIEQLDPCRFSFGGIGRRIFRKMMRDKNVASLPELRQTAIDLGVRFYACKTSMEVMEIKREDLIDEVEAIAGVATMIKDAAESKIQMFV